MNTSTFTSTTMLTGHMRCHTSFPHSSATFITDVPTELGGRGEFPTPAAMLAATLASCMMSMLAYTGQVKGFHTDGISVKARCHEDKSGICSFELHITVPMSPSPQVRSLMEAAVRSCPVAHALHPNIGKNITWVYADTYLPD